MAIARLASGIQGLDELLVGGLPVNGTYVILGSHGTGKTTFGLEFIYRGATELNEPGVYVVLEENKERMLANALEFGWEFKKLESEKKVDIITPMKSLIDTSKNKVTGFSLKDLDINTLFLDVEKSVSRIGAKRVVIDTLSVFTLLMEKEIDVRLMILSLIEKLRNLNVTSLIILEEGTKYWNETIFICDGAIHLSVLERRGVYDRGIYVMKMRGVDHDMTRRPFKITEKGIEIYPREVLFSD